LQTQPVKGQSNINQSIDKITEALNAPAGMMTLALLNEAFIQDVDDKYFYKKWFALIESLLKLPDISRQYEAINAPAGILSETLLEKPFKQNLSDEYFYKEWLALIESLLKLPDISRQYVLVILFSKIDWFFPINKDWTQKHLLPIFHSRKSIDRDAAWSGFFPANMFWLCYSGKLIGFFQSIKIGPKPANMFWLCYSGKLIGFLRSIKIGPKKICYQFSTAANLSTATLHGQAF